MHKFGTVILYNRTIDTGCYHAMVPCKAAPSAGGEPPLADGGTSPVGGGGIIGGAPPLKTPFVPSELPVQTALSNMKSRGLIAPSDPPFQIIRHIFRKPLDKAE